MIFADSSLGMCTPPSMMNTGTFASLKRTQSLLQYEGMAGGAPRLTARAFSACAAACAASAAIASDKCGGGGAVDRRASDKCSESRKIT